MFSKENIQQKMLYMAEACEFLAQFADTAPEDLAGREDDLKKMRREIYICLEELRYICGNIAAECGNKGGGDLLSTMQSLINMQIIPLDLAKAIMKIDPMKMKLMHQTRIDVPQLLETARTLIPILQGFDQYIGIFLSRMR